MSWNVLETRTRQAPATVAVVNQKGGVGKTTTVVNLGAALALRGHRIAVVDLDPQANATTGLGLDRRSVTAGSYELLAGEATPEDVLRTTRIKGLELVPSSSDLAGAEVELAGASEREFRLARALEGLEPRPDLVLVDCPPSLGLLTVNALAAADDLLVPVQCEYYALEGLSALVETAERARSTLNPRLTIAGVLLTMFDGRTKLAGQVVAEVRRHFGARVFDTVIPRSVRLSEAPSFGEPVLTLDPGARASTCYRLLAKEVETLYSLRVHPPAPPEPAVAAAAPGPFGRGYGTVAPEPVVAGAWPRGAAWEDA